MLCRVLLVDDDPLVLSALRRELLRKPDIGAEGIEVEAFATGEEALRRAAEPDGYFDVAIVDYRMRGMDGIAFFERLRQSQPETVRILLTGLIDMDGAIAAINAARIDQLVAKPWIEYDLKGRIALALHQRALTRRRALAPAAETPPARTAPFYLMLVDDEAAQLRALERELSLQGRATQGPHRLFEIMSATSPSLALVEATQRCPDIVIADYAMPELDGIDLLARLRGLCPQCVCILMSGRADTQVLADAINRAGVYHYIAKPWDAAALRAIMAEAMKHRELLRASAPA
jgi:response regulator RpfG family c-di-GMP phosphodiesterase